MESAPERKPFDKIDQSNLLSRAADRNKIIELLQEAVAQANSNTKRLLFVEGDSGVGKTVLLGDLQQYLKEKHRDWRILGPYDAREFVTKTPFARFIALMNECAGRTLLPIQDPLAVTVEDIINCAGLLELELTNRVNEPLLLIFDELEWWLDLEGEQRTVLDYLFRNVWRALLRQSAMPCLIICAGRRLPVFRDVLLRRTLQEVKIVGFAGNDLQRLIAAPHDPALLDFILKRANGNPWVTQLLAQEVQAHPIVDPIVKTTK